jgi:hypothetical protein
MYLSDRRPRTAIIARPQAAAFPSARRPQPSGTPRLDPMTATRATRAASTTKSTKRPRWTSPRRRTRRRAALALVPEEPLFSRRPTPDATHTMWPSRTLPPRTFDRCPHTVTGHGANRTKTGFTSMAGVMSRGPHKRLLEPFVAQECLLYYVSPIAAASPQAPRHYTSCPGGTTPFSFPRWPKLWMIDQTVRLSFSILADMASNDTPKCSMDARRYLSYWVQNDTVCDGDAAIGKRQFAAVLYLLRLHVTKICMNAWSGYNPGIHFLIFNICTCHFLALWPASEMSSGTTTGIANTD